MPLLDKWANFYVIVGSSAGALIGLQFVVMTLLAEIPPAREEVQAGDAFGSPNVVHFGVVLLLSAIVSAPWGSLRAVAIVWGAVGLIGLAYIGVVARRMRLQTAYRPVFEDWLFHAVLPVAALRRSGRVGGRGLLPSAASAVPSRRRGAAPAVHWHSQCVGYRDVSRLCAQTRAERI